MAQPLGDRHPGRQVAYASSSSAYKITPHHKHLESLKTLFTNYVYFML